MKIFRLALYLCLTLAFTFHSWSAEEVAAEPDIPAILRKVSEVDLLVPKGWRILDQATGDLNNDGTPDKVVIIESADLTSENSSAPRLLIVLLADKDSSVFEVSAVSYKSVRPRHTGAIFGDPFEELKIERGTFVISHYAGSRDRWGFQHRYRWQDGGWFLIGRTTINHDTLSPEHRKKDENLITGRVIEKIVDKEGNKTETDKKVEPVALIPLGLGRWEEDGYFKLP